MLLLDNYDSFTYNLQDYFAQLHTKCLIIRNDDKSVEEIAAMNPDAIVFSAGPETPNKAGVMMELIKFFHDKIPLLGICLGHQAIGEFFGAMLTKALKPMHGKTSLIYHTNHPIFNNLPNPMVVMRYHSLILQNINTDALHVIATTENDEVMAIAHSHYKICGIQFHPESILTPMGISILDNWLSWSSLK